MRIPFEATARSVLLLGAMALLMPLAAANATLPKSGAAAPPAATPPTPAPAPVRARESITPRRITLDNGLRVILAPSNDAPTAAVVIVFEVGELHDPPAASGMAQLLQQLLLTSAAGTVAARDAADLGRRYPLGWGGQAFADHTAIGVIVGGDRVDTEIAEFAARLSSLQVKEEDLEREKLRAIERVRSMRESQPGFAALHAARASVSALPEGAVAGGVPEQIISISLANARERLQRLYRPPNATMTVTGAFDADTVEKRLRSLMGSLERGESVAAPTPRPAPTASRPIDRRAVMIPIDPAAPSPDGANSAASVDPAAAGIGGFHAHAAIAVRPPLLSDRDSAAFLLLAHRLHRLEERDGWFANAEAPSFLTLYLDPLTPFVFVRPCRGDCEKALEAMEERLAGSAEMTPEEFQALREELLRDAAWMTGEAPISAEIVRTSPYGAGYALARQWQCGIDPSARVAAMKSLDLGSLDDARRRIFDPSRIARVIVSPVAAPRSESPSPENP